MRQQERLLASPERRASVHGAQGPTAIGEPTAPTGAWQCRFALAVHVRSTVGRVPLRNPLSADGCSLRSRKRAETRQALVDSAYALVRDYGFENLTAEAVADRAGLSRRMFFNHFPSVESVLTASVTEFFASVGVRLEARPADEDVLDSALLSSPTRATKTSSSGSASSPLRARRPPTRGGSSSSSCTPGWTGSRAGSADASARTPPTFSSRPTPRRSSARPRVRSGTGSGPPRPPAGTTTSRPSRRASPAPSPTSAPVSAPARAAAAAPAD